MGVATGCGFKEIYRFPHTTYPYSSCICTFLQQHPYFFFHFVKMIYIYIRPCKLNNRFLVQVNEQNQARHKAFFNFFLSKPIGVVNFNTKLSSTRTVKHLTEYKLGVKTLKSLQMTELE